MAGDEHRVAVLGGEVREHLQQLLPDHGVQAAGGLVQEQQPGPVGQRGGNTQLHGHAPGVLLELLVSRELEFVQPPLVGVLLPVSVGVGHDLPQLPGGDELRHAGLVQHHADLLLHLLELLALVVHPQDLHRAAVPLHGVHDEPDGGALPGPVGSHQAQDAAHGQGQVQALQGEVLVPLGQSLDLYGVHVPYSSSLNTRSMLSKSSNVRPHWRPRSTAAWRCSSISRSPASFCNSRSCSDTKQPLPATV